MQSLTIQKGRSTRIGKFLGSHSRYHFLQKTKTTLLESYFVRIRSRRDIYIRETGCDIFPLYFWKARWIEDEPIAARGIQIWKNIVDVVKYWLSLSKSKHLCNNKSFGTGKLVISKLHFLSISHQSWGCFYSDFNPLNQ